MRVGGTLGSPRAGGSVGEALAGGAGHGTNTAAARRSCTSCWSEGSPGWGGRGAVLSPAAAYLGAGEGSSAVSWSASKRSSGRKAGGSLLRSTRGCPAWLQRLSGAPSLCTAGHKGLGLEGGSDRSIRLGATGAVWGQVTPPRQQMLLPSLTKHC